MDTRTQRVGVWDIAIAGVLTALGAWLSLININDPEIGASWLAVPAFAAVTIPVIWRRRSPLAVVGAVVVALALNVVLVGDLIRCGVVFPTLFLMAFTVAGRLDRVPALAGLGIALVGVVLVSTTDPVIAPDVIPVFGGLTAAMWAVGRVVRSRMQLAGELAKRNEELRARRDERAAMQVAVDRTRLSGELEVLLRSRLDALSKAADAGSVAADPAAAKAMLEQIEADSRSTLEEMRQIVGVLRGTDAPAPVAPAPSIGHLDALLARSTRADARISVDGDPRTLPAAVELSAYRIVEQLVTAMTDDPDASIDVRMAFSDDALEIRLAGPVARSVDVKTALARARERAALHGGSLRTRVSRGRLDAVAELRVAAGV